MICLIDSRYILFRSAHTMRGLSSGEIPTASIYGMCMTVRSFAKLYPDARFLLCWDVHEKGDQVSFRRELIPEYKKGRHNDPELLKEVNIQQDIIETEFPLPQWKVPGAEADDLIASICRVIDDEVICIISNDKDLWSLLKPNVFIQKSVSDSIINEAKMAEDFNGVTPDLWPLVKAIAGDKSDNISGVPRIREKTASKMIAEKTVYDLLSDPEVKALVERNLQVVTLQSQFVGWPEPQGIDVKAWNEFCDKYEMVTAKIGHDMKDVEARLVDRDPSDFSFPEVPPDFVTGLVDRFKD